MRNNSTRSRVKSAALMAVLSSAAVLMGASSASADTAPNFSNPAFEMTNKAVVASGTCIARYAGALDDRSKSAPEIGQLIAKRCAKEISRSVGLASWMVGKPEEFSKMLKYTQEDLTTGAVMRYRASGARPHTV